MNVLVTGGAGYIGSHAVQRLLRDGHRVVVIDNLYRGHCAAIDRLRAMPGGDRLTFHEMDLDQRERLRTIIDEAKIDTVMHFAAHAYVGESVEHPLRYYRQNTASALALLEACDAAHGGAGVPRLVFSSTCATYGQPRADRIPIDETCPQSPMSPYGWSKLHVEQMLRDYAEACRRSGKAFAYAALRYFNVAGSDRTGLIGEDHRPETHLIPVILEACLGQREKVVVFGTDYPTPDGTNIRDYIHVEDLIDAHVRVMDAIKPGDERAYNLGIGRGYSVRQILDATRRVTGVEFKVEYGPRRAGDPPALFNNPAKVERELGWRARVPEIDEIIASAWRWRQAHPKGYVT
jgi:UDP-glucose 4-epimerase